ncbi:MAG: NifU family protein [Alphaproteobacteria bacterium]|nr:NifU family protein [Alphaproteobacteria bacterium]
MFIQTEATPNPATLKFLPGRPVMTGGVREFKTPESAVASPLVESFFQLPGVRGVFLGADFISITKDDQTEWSSLKMPVMSAIMDHFMSGMPLIREGHDAVDTASDLDDDITKQIKELLETRVRPMVAMDGGDIVFDRFDQGVVFLHMRGACSGCPSSTITLKNGIENMLRHYVPEVLEVRSAAE